MKLYEKNFMNKLYEKKMFQNTAQSEEAMALL